MNTGRVTGFKTLSSSYLEVPAYADMISTLPEGFLDSGG